MFDYKTYADHNGRNPSHVPGGYTRQQRRYAERMEVKRLRREENARVHSAHRRSRRRAA